MRKQVVKSSGKIEKKETVVERKKKEALEKKRIEKMRMLDDCPISLLPHQTQHVEEVWDSLVKRGNFSYLSTAGTGTGKTITTLYILYSLQKKYGLKAFLVAPNETSLHNDDGWLAHAKTMDVKFEEAMTYTTLRGVSGRLKHDWLTANPDDKKDWRATPELIALCKEGCFFIFDEMHHVKNESSQAFAAQALVRTAKKYKKNCKVCLLSFTPGEKGTHGQNLLKMAGVITNPKMFRHIPFTRDYEIDGYGLGELIQVCKKLLPDRAHEFDNVIGKMSKARCEEICLLLYQHVIRQTLTFSMPAAIQTCKVTRLNAFLETDLECMQQMENGLEVLKRAVNFNNGEIGEKAVWNMANIARGLAMLEEAKLPAIARYVVSEYRKDPSKKFVISCGAFAVRHHKVLQELIFRSKKPEDFVPILTELRKKNPLWKKLPVDVINHHILPYLCETVNDAKILNGKTKQEDRIKIMRDFQENSNKSWCIIMNPQIGAEAISLHDKHGGYSREMLISVDYHYSRIVQGTGRVDRTGTKSDTKIMLIYSKSLTEERQLLYGMMEKAETAKMLLAENQKVFLPDKYPVWIEGAMTPEMEIFRQEMANRNIDNNL